MAEPNYTTEGPVLYEFVDNSPPCPPGTPATPRPPGRPREGEPTPLATEADVAFARELADRVRTYSLTQPTRLTAEQLTTLVWKHLVRTSTE